VALNGSSEPPLIFFLSLDARCRIVFNEMDFLTFSPITRANAVERVLCSVHTQHSHTNNSFAPGAHQTDSHRHVCVNYCCVGRRARAIIKGAKSHYFPSALCVFARSLVVIVMCPGIESERERERGHREAAVLQFANSQYPSRPGQ